MWLSSWRYHSPVKSNLCPSKSASVICSNFAMVLFASCRISVSISGRAASIRAIVRRRSEVWYIQIKFSSSTLKFMRQTSISCCLLRAALPDMDTEMQRLTNSTLAKLERMTDADFDGQRFDFVSH